MTHIAPRIHELQPTKGNYFILDFELGALKNFLDCSIQEQGAEFEGISKKNEAGEYPEIEDLESAYDHPMMRQFITVRAIYYELNSIIEGELQHSAFVPWLESKRQRTQAVDFDKLTLESLRSWKMVSDEPFKKVLELIEKKYGIEIKDLDGADTFFHLREMVNSFKHRKGMIDFRKQSQENMKIGAFHEYDAGKAYDDIDKAKTFITALWKATERYPS